MSELNELQLDAKILDSVARRIVSRCDALGEISDTPSSLTRTFCSDAMKRAHGVLESWMQAAGMDSQLDSFGNLVGRYLGGGSKDVFMIGSHLDTVVNAGKFDGTLGVLLGLGVVEVIHELGVALPFDVDVIGFSEEEGVRFGFPFIGSLGITGRLHSGELDRTDANGVTIREALAEFGCASEEAKSNAIQSGKRQLVGFLEAHLEQATRLQQEGSAVGVVSAIAGQTRATIVLEGKSGHAGTVLHGERQDALAAAAKLILDIEELGQRTPGLFATVGTISALPGNSNVIADQVTLTLDLRHESDEVRDAAMQTIELMIRELGLIRLVAGRIHRANHFPAVPMDDSMTRHLSMAAEQVQGAVSTMVSGAGHDAMIMAKFAPSCMLFIRCRDGVSHHPDESVAPADIRVALDVMTRALLQIAQSTAKGTA